MGTILKQLFATVLGIILSVVILIVAIVIGLNILVSGLIPEKTYKLDRGTLLEISMNNIYRDSPSLSPLAALRSFAMNTPPEISMLDLSMAMEFAAADPNITAISLRLDGEERLSLATAAEMRSLLSDFKTLSGKPVYAYAESYTQAEYLLASVADRVYLHPEGAIEWQGVAINGLYFGGLLDELGVKAEVFRPEGCSYKSAVEPYYATEMSEQSREQNQRLVTSLWGSILREVSQSRGLNTGSLREMARNEIVVEPEKALSSRMIDVVAYRDEYDADVELAGIVVDDGKKLRTISMGNYSSYVAQKIDAVNLAEGSSENKIAVIYADGTIVDGDLLSTSPNEVVSGVVARQLRRARNDDEVRAVIMRVNSPGGSALASDVIWREMELVREVKPLIVSFGAYAASGGYYISTPADIILTSPYTITGSIGVYGVMFAYEDALRNKLKISTDGVVSSPSADFGRSAREITPIERAAMMRSVDKVYTTFQNCVINGRHLSAEEVARLSGGRVWSGEEALELGLVDGVGGIRKALLLANERCGLSGERVEIVEYNEFEQDWESMFGELFMGSSAAVLSDVKQLFERHNGVMALSPERVNF